MKVMKGSCKRKIRSCEQKRKRNERRKDSGVMAEYHNTRQVRRKGYEKEQKRRRKWWEALLSLRKIEREQRKKELEKPQEQVQEQVQEEQS